MPWNWISGLAGRLAKAARPALAAGLLFAAGCAQPRSDDLGANQSLVEIGEISLEQAESLEGRGSIDEANVAYRRALWAFRYHEKLTSEQPFLMDEALEGVKRTATKRR